VKKDLLKDPAGIFNSISKLPPYLGILIWGNFFMALSRLRGVTQTIHLIRLVSDKLALHKGRLDAYADKIDWLFRRLPFLFLSKKQGCLIRGFLLYFFCKRRRFKVQLHFGCRLEKGMLHTHCWIVQDGYICFEVEDVIRRYTTLVEYV